MITTAFRSKGKAVKESVKEYVRSRTPKGLFEAVSSVRAEWRIFLRHRAALAKVGQFLERPEKNVNLGCGANPKPGWINIDIFDSHADLQLDLREKWPFANASISHIYSEHVFEHFDFHNEVPHFPSEARRVLLSEGLFDVGVPDVENALRGYGDPANPVWRVLKTIHPQWCETQLDHINYIFRQVTEHRYAWDYQTLASVLGKSGFVNITRREFDPLLDTRPGTLFLRANNP